jgi:amylosucrase
MIEVLWLDTVAFIWKQMDTGCENLPEAHTLTDPGVQRRGAHCNLCVDLQIQSRYDPYNVVQCILPPECQMSYKPITMALL